MVCAASWPRPSARLDEVEKTADQDGMLPLLNRRAFVRELTRYIAFTGRYNTPGLADLFRPQSSEEDQRHAMAMPRAMRCWRISPRCCMSHVRESDCVGRLGGDEFGVLLSHANQDQALKKADAAGGGAWKPRPRNGTATPFRSASPMARSS